MFFLDVVFYRFVVVFGIEVVLSGEEELDVVFGSLKSFGEFVGGYFC